jgi:hypothetical protein
MNQQPANLPSGLDIRIVDHTAILPSSVLPTFNSHAIETVLHLIPDLAEHFIYFNDDMFLGAPVQPSDFFDQRGRAVLPWEENKALLHTSRFDNAYQSALFTSALLVAQNFGLPAAAYACRYPSHTVLPKTKQSFEQAWRLCPAEMQATQQARFRAFGQVIHFMTDYMDIAAGKVLLIKGDARYFATDQLLYEHWLLAGTVPKLFCINQVRTNRFAEIMNVTLKARQSTSVKIRRRKF